jgi:hypothetical protein
MATGNVTLNIKVDVPTIRVTINTYQGEFLAEFTCWEHELRARLAKDWGAEQPATYEYAVLINGVDAGPVYAAADNFEYDREMFK